MILTHNHPLKGRGDLGTNLVELESPVLQSVGRAEAQPGAEVLELLVLQPAGRRGLEPSLLE